MPRDTRCGDDAASGTRAWRDPRSVHGGCDANDRVQLQRSLVRFRHCTARRTFETCESSVPMKNIEIDIFFVRMWKTSPYHYLI
jgi:hypothetical protein